MLTYTEPLGRLVRAPIRWIPPRTVVRILSGPSRGLKWRKGSYTTGCWLGTYEREFAHQFAHAIRPGMVVYDIGANVGYFTLIAARRVTSTGRVYAFEPIKRNRERLLDQVSLNGFQSRTTVREVAIGDQCGIVTFAAGDNDAEWHLGAGSVTARMETIDWQLDQGIVQPPDVIKIDTEGAEPKAFAGAERTLRQYHPLIFMGDGVTAETEAMLGAFGYRHLSRTAKGDLIAR